MSVNSVNGQWGDNQYANVISCSSRQISELWTGLKSRIFIKILPSFSPEIIQPWIRTSATRFPMIMNGEYIHHLSNSAVEPQQKEKREYTLLDYFPTTLAALGAEIDGNRLGLGTNVFSYEQTLVERFGLDTVGEELRKKSRFMEDLEKEDE